MKNLTYFPFERNRYFYGKLLTVDDFELEQKYMNDKRRMMNRFLYGCGVVCGMNVVRVDDVTVSVEMGLALDFSGREIVIDTPVIQKLSMMDGFDADNDTAGYTYLCIEYAEIGKEPVHSIASAGARATDNTEYNKLAEGYRMFLSTQEPERDTFTTEYYYRDTETVYWGNGLRIRQSLPRYVRAGGEAQLRIVVENMGQQQPFSFEYDVSLTCLSHEDEKRLHVSFDEKEYNHAGRYEFSYPLTAAIVKDADGRAEVVSGSLHLKIGGRDIIGESVCCNRCMVSDRDGKQELMTSYYKTAMEEIVKNTYQQPIYLARIRLIRAGGAYVIEEVEPMPFGQYVRSNALTAAVDDVTMEELERLRIGGNGETAELKPRVLTQTEPHSVATGSVVLDLGIGGRAGQKFFSEEIFHGLGLGPVSIILGEAHTLSDDSDRIFGDLEVFEDMELDLVTTAKLGARVNIKKGSFVIGAMTTVPANASKLRIDWTAIRDRKQTLQEIEAKTLLIRPDMVDMEVRDDCYFEAVFTGVADRRVRWTVQDPRGGEIDGNGHYTAPNEAGVYEVSAQSLAYPELTTSVYVVVREGIRANERLV